MRHLISLDLSSVSTKKLAKSNQSLAFQPATQKPHTLLETINTRTDKDIKKN